MFLGGGAPAITALAVILAWAPRPGRRAGMMAAGLSYSAAARFS